MFLSQRKYKRLTLAVAVWLGMTATALTSVGFAAEATKNVENTADETTSDETVSNDSAEAASTEEQNSNSAWWAKEHETAPPADKSDEQTSEPKDGGTVTRPTKIDGPWWTRTEEDVETVNKNDIKPPADDKSADAENLPQDKSAPANEQPAEKEKPKIETVDLDKAKDIAEPDAKRAETWGEQRPEEDDVTDSMEQFDGKTVVDVIFDGATRATYATARTAISVRAGSEFSAEKVSADRDAIFDTGYFYDLYPSFEEVPEGVIITYHVLENPILTDISFSGNSVESDDTINELLTVQKGEILNSNVLHENMEAITAKYRTDGYILAKITDMNIDKDGKLSLSINEGILEGYKVKGNKKTKDFVILREMRQKTGEPFNAKLARRSMQRVYNLGFFEDVNIKMNPGVEPNAVVMELDVKEKRTGTFGIGAGYSSADGIIGMVSVSETNLGGRGDAIRVSYEMSGDDEDAHGYMFSYRRPWLDRHETAATLRVYNRTYEYDDYDTKGNLKEEYMRKYSGGEITLSRPISEFSTNYITFRRREEKYVKHKSNGNAGDRSEDWAWRKKNFGVTQSVTLEHVTDTRDNIYNPTSGGRVSLSGEFAGLGGDFSFQKYTIEDNRYIKVGRSQVLALRGQYGIGTGNISEFNQYRVGGQNSLRGYRDDQFRGNRMILATVEYRFPIVNKVQGAIFTDWGGAWDNGIVPEGTNGSVGAGLSLNTPLGPLRLDYGYGRQGGRMHFTVGGTF